MTVLQRELLHETTGSQEPSQAGGTASLAHHSSGKQRHERRKRRLAERQIDAVEGLAVERDGSVRPPKPVVLRDGHDSPIPRREGQQGGEVTEGAGREGQQGGEVTEGAGRGDSEEDDEVALTRCPRAAATTDEPLNAVVCTPSMWI